MKYSSKHILNKNLKAIEPEDGTKFYVVYVQVIYKRKNYMFKSIVKNYYTDLSYASHEDRAKMDYELKLLDDILVFEIGAKGEKFDLPGFADKYNHYRRSVVEEAERLLIGKLDAAINCKYIKYQGIFNINYISGKFTILLESAEKLMPEMKKDKEILQLQLAKEFWETYMKTFPEYSKGGLIHPTIFEWVSSDHLKVMKNNYSYNKIDNIDLLYEYLDEFDFGIKEVTINI